MDRLSPLDAAFLEAEDADRHTSMAIASIAVFEGPAPSYEEFAAGIAGRLALVPRYRQKVRRVPLDLGAPRWVDDPAFDLSWHLRQTALPPPGDEAALRRLMGRVMAQRLDRDRPLWEYWLVDGLTDDRWALISKVHHCMVDGVSGTDLYRVLLDLTPEPGPAVPDVWSPAPEPSTLSLTATSLAEIAANPVVQLRAAARGLRHPAETGRRLVGTGRGLLRLAAAARPAGATSLLGTTGAQRRFAWARGSLDDVRTIRRALGGTVNDVVLTAISGGFRALLLARDEQPQPHSIRSLVPVSVRAPGEESIRDNRVSAMLAFLPVHVADPVERLEAVRNELQALKDSHEAEAGVAVTSVAGYEPFPLFALPLRAAFRLPQRSVTTVTTNVPGPPMPLYALGRRVVEIVPYVPIADGLRIGVSIFSYCGRLTFGVTGDYDAAGDVEVLAHAIERSLDELTKAAKATTTG